MRLHNLAVSGATWSQVRADQLAAARRLVPDVVLTGVPDMGSVPRLAQPLRWVAGRRTGQLNDVIERIVAERRLTLAPIAAETGPAFRADDDLFAADGFHPDAAGYALWRPVIAAALDRARERPPRAGGLRQARPARPRSAASGRRRASRRR